MGTVLVKSALDVTPDEIRQINQQRFEMEHLDRITHLDAAAQEPPAEGPPPCTDPCHRPDGRIRRQNSPTWVGDQLYNIDSVGQTRAAVIPSGIAELRPVGANLIVLGRSSGAADGVMRVGTSDPEPLRIEVGAPVAASHSRSVLSQEPETMRRPSGVKRGVRAVARASSGRN